MEMDVVRLPPWRQGMYIDHNEFIVPLDWRYELEKWMYGASFIAGVIAFVHTVRRLIKTERKRLILAARLLSYKLSLTVADAIILFIYAPVQFLWISTFWWNAGDTGCRIFKFISAFGFHLTANMQVLIAFDRLYLSATMRTCRLSNKQEPYNTRFCLALSWALALLFSFPQMLVFGTKTADGKHDQCVTLWFQRRMDHVEQLEYLRAYHEHLHLRANTSSELYFPNGTLRHWVDAPPFTEESIVLEADTYVLVEQIYNAVHLATICVLPYLMELGCYAILLYILKGAQKGVFMSIGDVIKATVCCAPSPQRPMSIRRSVSSTSAERSGRKMEPTEDSGLLSVPDATPIMRIRSASCSMLAQEQSCCPSPSPSQRFFDSAYRISDYLCCVFSSHQKLSESKRESTVESTQRTTIPWLATVGSARRKARQKAFWMLSVNLLFWLPYCLLAVVSTVTVYAQFANFQFVMALVAFNAVSNLLL